MDVLTIEIEAVNLEALYDLQKQGVVVHPKPEALEIIKDKGTQKQFYEKHNMPTSDFTIYDDFQDQVIIISLLILFVPFTPF